MTIQRANTAWLNECISAQGYNVIWPVQAARIVALRHVCTLGDITSCDLCRFPGQLFTSVQLDAVYVLQHQQPLHVLVEKRLQLLVVHPRADDPDDESCDRGPGPEIHQPLFSLWGSITGQNDCCIHMVIDFIWLLSSNGYSVDMVILYISVSWRMKLIFLLVIIINDGLASHLSDLCMPPRCTLIWDHLWHLNQSLSISWTKLRR